MLKDKVILITGASRGIGRATALLAAENGAHVIINYNKSDREASDLVEIIRGKGQNALAIKADVSREIEVRELFQAIKEKYGRLDVLVNNAGIMKNNLLMLVKPDEYEEIVNINCKAPFLCMQQATKMMIKQKSGKIINVSSIVGTNGNVGQTVYSASKAFIVGLTKSAAKELGGYGITVNAVAPGLIDTDLIKVVKEDVKKELVSKTSLKRIGKPEDVAKVIVFLSSGQGDYVSGQIIGVDGCQIM